MSASEDDWRRMGQEVFLLGKSFEYKVYAHRLTNADHDHCEFCGVKFSNKPDDLHMGYSTDGDYRWVCPRCFSDFLEEFNWQLRGEGVGKPSI